MRIALANHGAHPFVGWVRRNIDWMPPHKAGQVEGARYVLGNSTGKDTRAIHVHVELQPGERRSLDMTESRPWDWAPEPPNGMSWFGGPIKLNGLTLPVLDIKTDGPAYVAHMRLRHGEMVSEVWLTQYPGQPWAEGRILTVHSTPRTDKLLTQAPAIKLEFGNGIVYVEGREIWQPLADAKPVADGQGNALPFSVFWPSHSTAKQGASWKMQAGGLIGCAALHRLLPDGNPQYAPGFDPMAWSRQHWRGAVDRLHDYGYPVVGIAPTSSQTGSQEDQLFVRGESLLPGGAGAEHVAYLSACKYAQRPCHHYEDSGAPLDLAAHPGMFFWSSRPHRLSPDRLGKKRDLAAWDAPGNWFGPDREHWLLGTLAAAARIYGCPMLQRLLEHQATSFLAGETIDRSLSTSHCDAARSVGYAGMVAVHLYEGLANRELADKVADRWVDRVEKVYVPELSGLPGGIWDSRADESITADLDGYQRGTMFWQQSLGAYGLDLACTIIGGKGGRDLALAAAKAVIAHAWRKQPNGRWIFWDNVGYTDGTVLPAAEYVEGKGAHRTGWFDHSWAVPGIATILRHEPYHAEALQIWDQVANGGGSWVPPGV